MPRALHPAPKARSRTHESRLGAPPPPSRPGPHVLRSPSAHEHRFLPATHVCAARNLKSRTSSCLIFLRSATHDRTNCFDDPFPFAQIGGQLLLSVGRDPVVSGSLLTLRLFPFGTYPALAFQSVKS